MDFFYFAIYLGNLLNYIDRGLISTLLPIFETEFQLSKVEEGLLSSSFMIGYTIFSFIFSVLASRYAKKSLLIIGSVIWCLSCLLMACSTEKWSIYLARSISGIGEASFQSIVPMYLTETYGETTGRQKTSLFFTAIGIGFSIGILIGGIVTHWRIIYLVELVFGLVFITLFSFNKPILPETDLTDSEQINSPVNISEIKKIKLILTNPSWWYGTVAYMFVAYSNGVLSLWLPTFYRENYSQTISYHLIAGILSVTLLAAGTIGSILGDKVSKLLAGEDFSQTHSLFRICQVAMIICFPFAICSVIFPENFAVSVLLLFFSLVCFSFIGIPNGMISVLTVPPYCRAYSTSLCILFLHLGGDMPSPILSSLIWEKTHDLRKAIGYSLLSLLLAILIYYLGYRHSRRQLYQKNTLLLQDNLMDQL